MAEDEDEDTTLWEEDTTRYTPGFSGVPGALSKEDIDALLELCYADPEEFCVTFLPDKFSKKMPWVHKGILAIITGRIDWLLQKCTLEELDKISRHFTWKLDPNDENSPEHPLFKIALSPEGLPVRIDMERAKFTSIVMPRGFSKTTLVGLACILYKILYQEHKFIVYVSETARAADLQLGNVKYELATNPLIQLCFGNIKPARDSELKWTANFFQTMTGIVVASRGRGAQIRGLNVNGQRPDIILVDDVEDKESVKTVEQREKTREWFFGDLMPALPAMDPEATIMCLGTVLHNEALLMVLENDPEWTSLRFGATDRDGAPLWEDNMPLAALERKKQSYALAGLLHAYYMEYESTLRAAESSKFSGPFLVKPEWRGELDCVAMALDPAISAKAGADFCSIAVAGITTKGFILLLDIWMQTGVPPDQQVDMFYALDKQWDVQRHGVETIAYQAALVYLIRGEMFRRKRYFVINEIKHGNTRKDERILGILQPRYKNGFIGHLRRFPEYESQLLDFPNGKKDGPDAFAMAITLLDPYAANMADPESNDLAANEYEPLGEWRSR